MRTRRRRPSLLLALVSSCLMVVLSACLSPAGLVASKVASADALHTVPMPVTSTSCPPDGTARAAVLRPLRLGGDQNIVYVYNEVPPTTSTAFPHLRRYDVVTGHKTELPVKEGLSIEQAQVSADGQWVLFV